MKVNLLIGFLSFNYWAWKRVEQETKTYSKIIWFIDLLTAIAQGTKSLNSNSNGFWIMGERKCKEREKENKRHYDEY